MTGGVPLSAIAGALSKPSMPMRDAARQKFRASRRRRPKPDFRGADQQAAKPLAATKPLMAMFIPVRYQVICGSSLNRSSTRSAGTRFRHDQTTAAPAFEQPAKPPEEFLSTHRDTRSRRCRRPAAQGRLAVSRHQGAGRRVTKPPPCLWDPEGAVARV